MRRQLRVTIDGHAYDVTVEDLTDTDNQLYPEPGSMAPPSAGADRPRSAPSASSASAPGGASSSSGGSVMSGTSGGSGAASRPEPPEGASPVTAPMSGVVVELPVKPGDVVEAGQVVAVLEAMKLKSPLAATRGGTVASVEVEVGQAVEVGATILLLT